MSSIFSCCFRKSDSIDVQPVKDKSPSPQPEDRNGSTRCVDTDDNDQSQNEFSEVHRETEILKTYRRPAAPRKKERHSRAPRALHRSTEQLVGVFGDAIDGEENGRIEVAIVGTGVKGCGAENDVMIRDNSGKDRSKRETRSSMLLDIEKTLADMHMSDQTTEENDDNEKPDNPPMPTDVNETTPTEPSEKSNSSDSKTEVLDTASTVLLNGDGAKSENVMSGLIDNDKDLGSALPTTETLDDDKCDKGTKDEKQSSENGSEMSSDKKNSKYNMSESSELPSVAKVCDEQEQPDTNIVQKHESPGSVETNINNEISTSSITGSDLCNTTFNGDKDKISITPEPSNSPERDNSKHKKIPPPVSPKPSPKFRAAVETKRTNSEYKNDTNSMNDKNAENSSALMLADNSNSENISNEKENIDGNKTVTPLEALIKPSSRECVSDSPNSLTAQTKTVTAIPHLTKPSSGIPLPKSKIPATTVTHTETDNKESDKSLHCEADSVGIEDLCSGEAVLVSRPPSSHSEHLNNSDAVKLKHEMRPDSSLETETPPSNGDCGSNQIISNNEDVPLSPKLPKSKIPTSPIMAEKLAKQAKVESPEEKDNRVRQRLHSDETKGKTSKIPVKGGPKSRVSPPKDDTR